MVWCPNWSKNLGRSLACLPSLLLAKFMCFLLLFCYRRKTAKCCHFFFRTTPATIVCLFSVHQASLASVHCLLLKKCIVFKRIFGQAKMIIKFIFCLQPSVISLCENTVEWSMSVSFNRNSQLHLSVLEVKGEPGTYWNGWQLFVANHWQPKNSNCLFVLPDS